MDLQALSIHLLLPFLLFVFVLLKLLKKLRTKNLTANLPPGPWKLPIIGNLHHLVGSLPHRRLHELAKKYGPIMHLKLGKVDHIIVSSPEVAKEMMKTHDIIFAQRPFLLAADLVAYNSADIAFAPYGDYWRHMRKICTLELLSAKRVQSFKSIREEEISNLVEHISFYTGSAINLSKLINSLTYSITARAAFGEKCVDQDEFIARAQDVTHAAGGFSFADVFPSIKILHRIGGMLSQLEMFVEKIRIKAGNPSKKTKNIGKKWFPVFQQRLLAKEEKKTRQKVLVVVNHSTHSRKMTYWNFCLKPGNAQEHDEHKLYNHIFSTMLHREIDKIAEKIVNDHKLRRRVVAESGDKKGVTDLVDVLLDVQEQGDLQFPLQSDNIKAIILDMFIAGSETSSATMEWMMSEMLRNPRVMKKAQEEVRQVFGKKGFVDESCLDQLNYLKLVIKETLRLHPPLPLLLPRECIEDCEVNHYLIPKNYKVIVNAMAISKNPNYWNEAESFCPERFSDSSIDYKGNCFEYIPFGAGRRICPGISFGMANLELPLANLLYHFDWKLGGGIKEEDLDMDEIFGATVRRKNFLNLIPFSCSPH